MIKRYLQAVLCLLFLSLAIMHVHIFAFASAQENIQIWNPKKVDWWVSLDDQVHQGVKQGCEIHWLYDNVLDVALNVSNKGRLYYSFEVTNDGRDLAIDYNQASAAYLVIDKVKNPLAIAKGNFSQVMMALPNDLNDLQVLQGARRLLLNIGGTLYNFPLENSVENFSYFKKCLKTLNVQLMTSKVTPSSQRPPIRAVPIEQKELLTASRLPVESPLGTQISQAIREEAITPESVKQFDGLLKDVQYSGVSEQKLEVPPEDSKASNKKEKNDLRAQQACPEAEYSDHSTGVIRNLTKKLAVLEREKEELRVKALDVSGNEILREVSNCKTPAEENLDEPLSDELIERFEDTINKLRAENELLKEASLQAEEDEADSGLLENEVDKLRQKINDLLRANEGLSDENDNLQEQIEELEDRCQAVDNIGESVIDSLFPTIPEKTTESPVSGVDEEVNNGANIDLEALAAENEALKAQFKAVTGDEIRDDATGRP